MIRVLCLAATALSANAMDETLLTATNLATVKDLVKGVHDTMGDYEGDGLSTPVLAAFEAVGTAGFSLKVTALVLSRCSSH